ncbi:hypothetical protein [Streptomyces sp. NPDC002845]
MTTRFDDGPDGPEFDPDDPLAVILRPTSAHLGPPPGRYEAIRRTASRRRLLRAAATGVGMVCAVAALIALPLHLTTPDAPASPSVPLAPPPTSDHSTRPTPSAVPTPSESPVPSVPPELVSPVPATTPGTDDSRTPVTPTDPAQGPSEPSAIPAPTQPPTSAGAVPSAIETDAAATPESGTGP